MQFTIIWQVLIKTNNKLRHSLQFFVQIIYYAMFCCYIYEIRAFMLCLACKEGRNSENYKNGQEKQVLLTYRSIFVLRLFKTTNQFRYSMSLVKIFNLNGWDWKRFRSVQRNFIFIFSLALGGKEREEFCFSLQTFVFRRSQIILFVVLIIFIFICTNARFKWILNFCWGFFYWNRFESNYKSHFWI